MLLARLTSPERLADIHLKFGWEPERVSYITSKTMEIIYHKWKHLLQWDPIRLTPQKLDEFARAITRKASPLINCIGFIDGTLRPISRPVRGQQSVYNG